MEIVARHRYYQCGHCHSVHMLEAPAVEGVRIVARRADAAACPFCDSPLAYALLDETFSVEHCERCRGVSIPRRSFAEAVLRMRARQTGPGATPPPTDTRDLTRKMVCPTCRATMDTRRYDGPGNIVIDACQNCDRIWLDYGELQRVIAAPGRDRGAP
jgi:Zn-finger nucleic acid-binding protein